MSNKKNNKKKNKATVTVTNPVLPAIKDFYTTQNQGIILLSGTTMQEIYKKTGPLADANEFQVHYWFLNFRLRAADNSILDIAIPTCYFNYEQFVTGAHIDFELRDVKELSAKLLPIHNMKANELIDMGIQDKLEKMFNAKFEMMAMDFGSIHKHPGGSRSQSFSGTDYCKTAAEPGVVYPLATATNDTPNFAGIMALDSKVNNVAHYEYRTVNGTLGTDIEYVEGRCAAITVFPKEEDNRSIVEKMLGIQQESTSKWKLKRCTKDMPVITAMETFAEWLYLSTTYKPSTDVIREENVKKKATVSTYNYGFNAYSRKKEGYKEISSLDDLQLMTLYKLNEHYKLCCEKLGRPTPTYCATKSIVVTDIVKAQNDIKELNAIFTKEELEGKNIRELNTLHNSRYFEVNNIQMYRYVANKDSCIEDILALQVKAEKKEKETPSKEPTTKYTRPVLIVKTKEELISICNHLNDTFYGESEIDDSASWATAAYTIYTAPALSMLIDEIMQLQEWMELEAKKPEIVLEDEPDPMGVPTIEEVRETLEEINTDPKALATATDEQLRKWYDSLEIQ